MRQTIGFYLVTFALFVLLLSYSVTLFFTHHDDAKRLFVGSVLLICPLIYFLPGTIKKDPKTFVLLALLAPLYLFYGGVIWIWDHWGWGLWFCFWSIVLEVGAILRNFVPKKLRQKK